MRLSRRVMELEESATLAVTGQAAKMKAQGIDVISFGAGEPDFDTPEHIKEAARKGLDRGVSKYTDVAGTLPLRKAIAAELSRVHHTQIAPEEVLVSSGAKHSLYNLFQALLDPGD